MYNVHSYVYRSFSFTSISTMRVHTYLNQKIHIHFHSFDFSLRIVRMIVVSTIRTFLDCVAALEVVQGVGSREGKRRTESKNDAQVNRYSTVAYIRVYGLCTS